jgi:hypothetical protein
MVEKYKDHLIVASATPEEGTGKFFAVASISWQTDGRREIHVIQDLKEHYDNNNAAIHFALAADKNWIDDRLNFLP